MSLEDFLSTSHSLAIQAEDVYRELDEYFESWAWDESKGVWPGLIDEEKRDA